MSTTPTSRMSSPSSAYQRRVVSPTAMIWDGSSVTPRDDHAPWRMSMVATTGFVVVETDVGDDAVVAEIQQATVIVDDDEQ